MGKGGQAGVGEEVQGQRKRGGGGQQGDAQAHRSACSDIFLTRFHCPAAELSGYPALALITVYLLQLRAHRCMTKACLRTVLLACPLVQCCCPHTALPPPCLSTCAVPLLTHNPPCLSLCHSATDDLVLDCPDAVRLLSLFLGRAIVDEILPPSFLTQVWGRGRGRRRRGRGRGGVMPV